MVLSFKESERKDLEKTWISKETKGNGTTDDDDITETKVLLRKIREVAPARSLGGSEIVKVNGVNVSKTMVGFCDACGDKLEEKIVVCRIDAKKICPTCAITDGQRKICPDCLLSIKPLSKDEYKVLICLKIYLSKSQIQKLTRIAKRDIETSIDYLLRTHYVSKLLLRGFEVTSRGVELETAYSQLYGRQQDVLELKRILDEHGAT